MSTFADNLKSLRKSFFLSQAAFADKMQVAQSTVSMWEKGMRTPPQKVLCEIADFFSVSVDSLLGNENIPLLGRGLAPILGTVRAGLPIFAEQNFDGYIGLSEENADSSFFALRVTGDSMNKVGILDGSLVVVRRQSNIENGSIAVVLVDDNEATVKKVYINGPVVTLMPCSTNPFYVPKDVDTRVSDLRILGKVEEVRISL